MNLLRALFFSLLIGVSAFAQLDKSERPAAAQAFGKARPVVLPQPDGLIICEGEEFQPGGEGWRAGNFGDNYYAATFANCFLSRKAFLGAPEQVDAEVSATIQVEVAEAGKYLALVRYEAAYRFETQFRLRVEQNGQQLLDRVYGARKNPKIWAFGEKLKSEVGWSWGASENIVWEGHDAFVDLKPGKATITLIAAGQPEPAARRNVDLVMLTTDVAQVQERIEKEKYLPLDGMLTQSGDVWLRVKNAGPDKLTFKGGKSSGAGQGNWTQHSPYWVHIRNWEAPVIEVEAGKTSDWVEVGGTMDSLAHGQWFWTGDGKYEAEFGVKNPAGAIEPLAKFAGEGALNLAGDCDTRYLKRLRRQEDVIYDLLDYLKAQPNTGKTPKRTLIYASTFEPMDEGGKHAKAVAEFKGLFNLQSSAGGSYIDVRSVKTEQLVEYCQTKLTAKPEDVRVVSLGDEIGLPGPRTDEEKAGFADWLKRQGANPAEIGAYDSTPELRESNPGRFYWSKRFDYDFGIRKIKERTDILRQQLPNAGIGANFSPHYPQEHLYLGEVFKWVSVFRQEGMTQPWGEDYIWQVPVASPQVNNINLDLFRAGLRGKPDAKIHYYVMPHMPNNTPDQWRRLFYGALAHGAKIINLFEFRPVHVAYTENHVDEPEMYAEVLRGFRELGVFEDVVQDGQVRQAEVALWFSESADIWGDSHGSFAAAKRGLYLALRHQQLPLDFVVEPDAIDGTLNQYKVLYLTDQHVSSAASVKIAKWVEGGGVLFATAGAGMFDELNRPNEMLRKLLGVDQTALDAPEGKQLIWIKQDMPFTDPIDQVGEMPVIGVRSRVKLTGAAALSAFADGSPAVTEHATGKGKAIYTAFLPGLTYFKPAIPKRPVDRGATDDAFVHFLPTEFDANAAALISSAAISIEKPVECSHPLVETTVIESKSGVVIPLVNWTREPAAGLEVIVRIPGKNARLASGGKISSEEQGVYTFDVEVADALILDR